MIYEDAVQECLDIIEKFKGKGFKKITELPESKDKARLRELFKEMGEKPKF